MSWTIAFWASLGTWIAFHSKVICISALWTPVRAWISIQILRCITLHAFVWSALNAIMRTNSAFSIHVICIESLRAFLHTLIERVCQVVIPFWTYIAVFRWSTLITVINTSFTIVNWLLIVGGYWTWIYTTTVDECLIWLRAWCATIYISIHTIHTRLMTTIASAFFFIREVVIWTKWCTDILRLVSRTRACRVVTSPSN